MAKKKNQEKSGKKRKENKKLDGFSMRFIHYSEIRDLGSDERIKKILDICLKNTIIILQGRLRPEEESRLIGDTMAMINHVKDFKGIELAVISEENHKSFWDRMRGNIINVLSKGDVGSLTVIGPATVVKEIKKNPQKIELFLNK